VRVGVLAALIVPSIAGLAHAQPPAPPPLSPSGRGVPLTVPAEPRADLRLLPTPRFRAGRLTLEPITKIHGDLVRFNPVVDDGDETRVWRRRRIGVKGNLGRYVSFEVERELGDQEDPWRDVYLNVKASDRFELRGGKFRIPFSLDATTGSTSHDFVFRSLAARTLAFGRDVGVMVRGRTAGRRLTYAVGVFDAGDPRDTTAGFFDDDNAGQNEGRTISGRVTVQPLDAPIDLPRGLRNIEFGVNVARETVPEGLNGLRGRSVHRHEFFAPVYVNGERLRVGVDVALFAGPASLKAEFIDVREERAEQGLGDVDLPAALGRGWYVAGSWLLTGEGKDDGDVRPRRPMFRGGIGALELAVRQERLGFGSVNADGEPAFANPRAANVLRTHDDVTTIGMTWFLNRWIRLQGNAIRESFFDVERAPIGGRKTYWSYVGRFQFVL
jgi:phosphate-selective porin OprO/OprP